MVGDHWLNMLVKLFLPIGLAVFSIAHGDESIGSITRINKRFSRAAVMIKENARVKDGDIILIRRKDGKKVCGGEAVIKSIKERRVILNISQCSSRKLVKKGMKLFLVQGDNRLFYRNISLSMFYTISQGSFLENYNSTKIKSSQNSPATLGSMFAYKRGKSLFSFSGSFYLSYLTSSSVAGEDRDLAVPLEYGLNSYVQGNFSKVGISSYLGFDYERFSTYNTKEISTGSDISLRNNNIGYLTLGLGKLFVVQKRKFLTKASLSYSLFSSSDEGEKFKGFKYIIYLNSVITKRLLIHFLYKVHLLKGPTDLIISRVGVGFGYRFF